MPVTIAQLRNAILSRDDIQLRDLVALADLIEAGLPAGAPAAVHSRVSRFSGQSIPTGASPTPIQWTAVEGDDDSFVNLVADDEIIMTVPAEFDGRLAMFSAGINWASSAVGSFRHAEFFALNPVFIDYSINSQIQLVASTLSPRMVIAGGPFQVAAGQTFGVRVAHDVGSNLSVAFAVAAIALL